MHRQAAVTADQPALGQVEPRRFAVRNPPLTVDAVVQARHKSLALRQVQQKAGQQRPPWLLGEGQARQRVQQEHEGFLRGDAGLDDVLDDAEEVRSDGQAVEISAQGVERLHQVRADDGKVIAALVQLKIAQGEQLAGVENRGARFAASAGKRLNAPLRRAEEGQHPVVVPVIGVAEDNRGVFGLFHSILPKRLRTVAHAQPLLICLLVRNQGREVNAVAHLAALRVRGRVNLLVVQYHGAGGTAIEVVGVLQAERARQLCRAPQVEADGFRALTFRAFCAKDDELHRGNLSENHALRQRLGAVVHAGVKLVADNAVNHQSGAEAERVGDRATVFQIILPFLMRRALNDVHTALCVDNHRVAVFAGQFTQTVRVAIDDSFRMVDEVVAVDGEDGVVAARHALHTLGILRGIGGCQRSANLRRIGDFDVHRHDGRRALAGFIDALDVLRPVGRFDANIQRIVVIAALIGQIAVRIRQIRRGKEFSARAVQPRKRLVGRFLRQRRAKHRQQRTRGDEFPQIFHLSIPFRRGEAQGALPLDPAREFLP